MKPKYFLVKEFDMNETLKVLESRRSCRKFVAGKMPSEEELKAVVRAGTFAPSGRGMQPVKILVVTNKDLRDRISAENAKILGREGFDPFYGAPAILVLVADKSSPMRHFDGALVAGNLLNAAESLGLGGIWIHRAKEEFDSEFGKKILSDLGIEGDYEGIAHIALGYPEEGGKAPAAPRKENVYWVR